MANDRLYFSTINAAQQRGLWVTDGTAVGTKEIKFGSVGLAGLAPTNFVAVSGKLFFNGFDGLIQTNLFVLDGATDTLTRLQVAGASSSGLSPSGITGYGEKVFFSGRNAGSATTLWTSDGTAAGTVELPVAGQGTFGLYPNHFALLGNKLAFAGSGVSFSNLFVSDGTSAGTAMVPVAGTAFTGLSIQSMASLGDRVVFTGARQVGGQSLWVSDGTAVGTTVLAVPGLNPTGSYTGKPAGLTRFEARVAFTAADASGASSIWITDGTVAGTMQLPGVFGPSYGARMTALPDGRLAFIASDAGGTSGVWLTDGTAANTVRLVVPGASAAGLQPIGVMALGGQLVFDGVAASGTRVLFASDGTPAGTSVLASGVSLVDSIGAVAAVLPGGNVRGSVRDDIFVDGPADQLFIGNGGHDILIVNESWRGSMVSVQANGDLTLIHRGQTDTARGVAEMRFIDGRMVLDANDPAAAVTRLYQASLGRPPDQGGLNFWIGAVQAGAPLADLATAFLASPEFATRFGTGLPNDSFVTALYQNVLGRAPDVGGLAFWTGNLDRGALTRGAALAGISESQENKSTTARLVAAGIWDRSEAAAQVSRLYGTALSRLPDAGGLGFWTNAIEGGAARLLDVAQSFVTSAEFMATYGALANRAFVERVYGNTLGRPGEAEGVDFWTNTLDNGASRAAVTIGFSESREYQARTAPDTGGEEVGTYGIKLA